MFPVINPFDDFCNKQQLLPRFLGIVVDLHRSAFLRLCSDAPVLLQQRSSVRFPPSAEAYADTPHWALAPLECTEFSSTEPRRMSGEASFSEQDDYMKAVNAERNAVLAYESSFSALMTR